LPTWPGANVLLRRFLRLIVLVVVFALSALVVVFFTMRGRPVKVPNVVGKTETQAAATLEEFGLRMQVKGRIHNEAVPANTVSDQSPAAEAVVKTGQFVRVSLSLGALPTPSPGG
jgi:beta-lactam-binding protein with PASTA domain